MGKISEFSIELDSNQLVYYPGQHVTGHVTIDLKEPMDMRGLRLIFVGEASSYWSERVGAGDNRRTVQCLAKRDFLKEERCLFGSGASSSGDCRTEHAAGKQTYKFSFRLPGNIPSSYEAANGYVRYILKGRIDKPWKFDHKVKRVFTVNDVIDCNKPAHLEPIGGEFDKTPGCLTFHTHPVQLSASIDHSCYCPGDAILITANAESSRNTKSLYAKLLQITTFNANHGKTMTTTKEISRVTGPVVTKGQVVVWNKQPIAVPAVAPSILNCSLVSVGYELHVVVTVTLGTDASVVIPITIGTIPNINTFGKEVTFGTAQDKWVPPKPKSPGTGEYPPLDLTGFGYPELGPVAYTEACDSACANIATDKDEYTFGNLSYTPVYTFAQPYQM